jgi:molybdate transport system ATP-binding protein
MPGRNDLSPMTLAATVRIELDGFVLDAELAITAGQTVAVVGPNGAGKTTLLRALAGLRGLSGGRIELDGTVYDDPDARIYVPPERRPVGVVFQDNLLFPHLSALENVAFGLRARGFSHREARRRAAEWLDRVGLDRRTRARPRELSGGQAQRVALARALAADPAMLLLDEPLAALDATTRNDVRRDLRRHLATFPGVRLLITHDPIDAAVLADYVVVLDHGRIAQMGTPAEITSRPRTRWVAELTGTNLFSGTARAEGRVALDAGGAIITADHDVSGSVFAVVHPRSVSLHRAKPEGSARNSWRGVVTAVEPVGDRYRVEVDSTPSVVAEVTPEAVREIGLREGVEVWAAIKATEVDVYPA